jgi:hypothetical protein
LNARAGRLGFLKEKKNQIADDLRDMDPRMSAQLHLERAVFRAIPQHSSPYY